MQVVYLITCIENITDYNLTQVASMLPKQDSPSHPAVLAGIYKDEVPFQDIMCYKCLSRYKEKVYLFSSELFH